MTPGEVAGGRAGRLARNIAGPFAAGLVVRALNTLYFILQVRLLPAPRPGQAGELDQYTFATVVLLYAGIIADWGLGTWLTREVAARRTAGEDTRRLFAETLALRLALAGLALPALLLLVGPGYGLFNLTPTAVVVLLLLGLSLLPGAFSGAVTALYNAHERMALPAVVQLVTATVNVGLGVGTLYLGFGAVGLAGAALLTTLATAAIFYRLLRRDFFAPALHWPAAALERVLRPAFPLMVNGLLIMVFFRFDIVLLGIFRPGEVAIYETAYKVINLTQIIAPSVVLALFPAMARYAVGDLAKLTRIYRAAVQALLFLAVPIVAATVALSGPLITAITLGKEGYQPYSAWALTILIFYLPLSFVNGVTQYVLIAVHQQGRLVWAIGATALFNIAANLLAVPAWGIYGAALVTVLSELVLLVPFLTWAEGALGYRALRLSPRALRLALAAALLTIIMTVLTADKWPATLALAGGLLAYAVVLYRDFRIQILEFRSLR